MKGGLKMTTIKIDDSISQQSSQLKDKLNTYEQAVVNGMSAVNQSMNVLKGESYEKLTGQLQKKVQAQIQLVAECQVLQSAIDQYLEEMIETESSITFE